MATNDLLRNMLSGLLGVDMSDFESIERSELKGLTVSTIRAPDGEHQYETAVMHPLYHNGNAIIVEAYDTIEKARVGHIKWFSDMIADPPPKLVDCCNSVLAPEKGSLVYTRSTVN